MKIITIGRNPGNNVVINDPLVGRNHCQIIQDDYGNFSLVDNNSTNGTFVNGQRRQGQVRLNPSDIVRIGNTTLPWMSYFPGGSGGSGGSGDTVIDGGTVGGKDAYTPPPTIPPTYLWQSIVVTILCCLPFGIPAIVNASRVQERFLKGDYAGAEKASSNAKTWAIVSLVAGIIGLIISIIYYTVVGTAIFMNY